MLVLSRKAAQRIVLTIGNETVTVEILKIAGNRVQVGIAAPPSVAIRRSEILTVECKPAVQANQKSNLIAVA